MNIVPDFLNLSLLNSNQNGIENKLAFIDILQNAPTKEDTAFGSPINDVCRQIESDQQKSKIDL